MIIVSPISSIYTLFNSTQNSNSPGPFFDPKLFLKIFGSITIIGSFLILNAYTAYDARQEILEENKLENKILKANELKKNISEESWFMKPFLLGEYFTANHYYNKYKY